MRLANVELLSRQLEAEASSTIGVGCVKQFLGVDKKDPQTSVEGSDSAVRVVNPMLANQTPTDDNNDDTIQTDETIQAGDTIQAGAIQGDEGGGLPVLDLYDTMVASDEENGDDADDLTNDVEYNVEDDYKALFAEYDLKEPAGFLDKHQLQHLIHDRYEWWQLGRRDCRLLP